MSKTWRFFFGGSGHGPESSCQILAYYKFFPGKSYFYRTTVKPLSDAKGKAAGTTNLDFSSMVRKEGENPKNEARG